MQVKHKHFVFYRLLFFIKDWCQIWYKIFFGFFVVRLSFCVSNFIPRNHWIINNTCKIFTIFATTYSRIPNVIFFIYMMFFAHSPIFIVILHLIWITFSTIKFTFIFAWYMLCNVFESFLPVIMFNKLRFKFCLENILY